MWRYFAAVGLMLALAACGDETTTPDDEGGGGDNTGGTGADGGTSATGGSGGGIVDRCPAVCVKLEALFASFGPSCMLQTCNCKPACADEFEASIDCISAGSGNCSCSGNELDCSICNDEVQAANACFDAN